MDRQQKLNQVAMNLRAFKYRYSVHIKEQISLAFPDLTTFTPFGGVSNVVAVSVCHPVTMTQLGKLPLSLLGDLLGDIVTELRYLDSTIYSQVRETGSFYLKLIFPGPLAPQFLGYPFRSIFTITVVPSGSS